MTVLIDTNVIIDALQSRKPWCDAAEQIFLKAASEQFTGYITAKSVTDIYYICHRFLHSDEETRKLLSKLFVLFKLVDTTAQDVQDALAMEITDYEDGVMIATAKRIGCDYIVTRNPQDYKKSTVPIASPDDFLNMFHD